MLNGFPCISLLITIVILWWIHQWPAINSCYCPLFSVVLRRRHWRSRPEAVGRRHPFHWRIIPPRTTKDLLLQLPPHLTHPPLTTDRPSAEQMTDRLRARAATSIDQRLMVSNHLTYSPCSSLHWVLPLVLLHCIYTVDMVQNTLSLSLSSSLCPLVRQLTLSSDNNIYLITDFERSLGRMYSSSHKRLLSVSLDVRYVRCSWGHDGEWLMSGNTGNA